VIPLAVLLAFATAVAAVPPVVVDGGEYPAVRGLYTPYDASTMHCAGKHCAKAKHGAWWTTTAHPSTQWVGATARGCRLHPAWGCYKRDMGGWRKLVRPYEANLTYYAAAGRLLRRIIREQYGRMPSIWHKRPFIRVRFSATMPNGITISRIAYVVDKCICEGRHTDPNDERVVDMSRALWRVFYPARLAGNRRILAEVMP